MRDMEKTLRQAELRVAMRRAIMTEKDAMDYYRYAGEKMYNERARLTFHLLAKEEREHARSFYDAYRWDDLPPFDELMAAPPDTGSEWWQALQQTMLGDFDEPLALTLAIERETTLEKSLRSIAEKVSDPAVREIFLNNARLTHHHLEMVEQDYQALMEGSRLE
jgi:rubrerythrin